MGEDDESIRWTSDRVTFTREAAVTGFSQKEGDCFSHGQEWVARVLMPPKTSGNWNYDTPQVKRVACGQLHRALRGAGCATGSRTRDDRKGSQMGFQMNTKALSKGNRRSILYQSTGYNTYSGARHQGREEDVFLEIY